MMQVLSRIVAMRNLKFPLDFSSLKFLPDFKNKNYSEAAAFTFLIVVPQFEQNMWVLNKEKWNVYIFMS